MATNEHDLTIYKPFRSEGGTNQVSQSPELDLKASETTFSESQQNVEGAMPTVLVTKERVKQDGRDLEVSQSGKQKCTSDTDSETDFDASTSPRFPRNFSSSTCTTHSAQSQHIFSEYSSDSSDGVGAPGGKGRYLLPVQEKQRCAVHKNSKGGKSQARRTALPPEYQFNIRPQTFASQWSKTKGFKGGGLKVKTTTSLSPNASETSGDCGTNAIVTITVKNAKLDCQYRASVKVALYDPSAGNLLSEEEEEERGFTGECGRVEFTVSLGSQRDIVSCRSRRLKLQVKVKVHQERTVS